MKNKKTIILVAVILVLILSIGVTFAYYVVGVKKVGTGATSNINTANTLKVEYNAGTSKLTGSNMYPGTKVSKDFTVKITPNNHTEDITYNIKLGITNNTFEVCNDTNYVSQTNECIKDAEELVYTLKENNTVIKTGNLTGVTEDTILANITKPATSATYTYTLEIEFIRLESDQNHNVNKTLTGDIKVEFAKKQNPIASEYLLAKNEMVHETFEDNGTTVDTGYRYEGANPNNYVTFNNETWRIIGVFDVKPSGSSTSQLLVKLIRDNDFLSIPWDGIRGESDWSKATLKEELNEGDHYNSLTAESKNMIQSAIWNLEGVSTNLTVSGMYMEERRNQTVWSGEIGLMYPSDYGYAVDSASCARSTVLASYSNTSLCKDNNWLFINNTQWTLTAQGGEAVIIGNDGNIYSDFTYNSFGARPAVYLKSNVKIVDNGKDGSASKPYDLVLE